VKGELGLAPRNIWPWEFPKPQGLSKWGLYFFTSREINWEINILHTLLLIHLTIMSFWVFFPKYKSITLIGTENEGEIIKNENQLYVRYRPVIRN
jgi:hypothetical protein